MGAVDILLLISIHTPARGVTSMDSNLSFKVTNFDPHPREGGDRHITASEENQI